MAGLAREEGRREQTPNGVGSCRGSDRPQRAREWDSQSFPWPAGGRV